MLTILSHTTTSSATEQLTAACPEYYNFMMACSKNIKNRNDINTINKLPPGKCIFILSQPSPTSQDNSPDEYYKCVDEEKEKYEQKEERKLKNTECKEAKKEIRDQNKACAEAKGKLRHGSDLKDCEEALKSGKKDYKSCPDIAAQDYDQIKDNYKDLKSEKTKLQDEVLDLSEKLSKMEGDMKTQLATFDEKIQKADQEAKKMDLELSGKTDMAAIISATKDNELLNEINELTEALDKIHLDYMTQFNNIRREQRKRRQECWDKAEKIVLEKKNKQLLELVTGKSQGGRKSVVGFFKRSGHRSIRQILMLERNKLYNDCMDSALERTEKSNDKDALAILDTTYKQRVHTVERKIKEKQKSLALRKAKEAKDYQFEVQKYLLQKEELFNAKYSAMKAKNDKEYADTKKAKQLEFRIMNKNSELQTLGTDFNQAQSLYNQLKKMDISTSIDKDAVSSAIFVCQYSDELKSVDSDCYNESSSKTGDQ